MATATMLTTIDADTHIDETEDTWEYMASSEAQFKPVVGYPSNPSPGRATQRFWVIDGDRQPRLHREDSKTMTTVETRELLDVGARLRDMDGVNVRAQVIYPTLFLVQPTTKAEGDVALKRAYNRWLGDRCAESEGRLGWLCLPPLMDMDEAVKEVRWAKDHGAVGIFKKGNREADHNFTDEYFDPLWAGRQRTGDGGLHAHRQRHPQHPREPDGWRFPGPPGALCLPARDFFIDGAEQVASPVSEHPLGVHRSRVRVDTARALPDQAAHGSSWFSGAIFEDAHVR